MTLQKFLFYLLLTTSSIFGQRKIDRATPLELCVFDTHDKTTLQAHRIASRKWPFVTKIVDKEMSCYPNLQDSIELKNRSIWLRLSKQGYQNPKQLYLSDVHREHQNLMKINALLKEWNLPDTIQLPKKETIHLNDVSKIAESLYEFTIDNFIATASLNTNSQLRVKVNLSTNTIEVIK
ncbi:hypothetical protein [Aquimarina brevivitae]|uniref:Uncharacterized protein n=1 Tax=Aquimarina brevivitae TaxID=323412 RepID=A0A4V2F7H5_9FLAO|nr:hypothetical protein [Aquimarina brevivitae]RZS99839.1 hypothetical protein EV197_1067 [Aquimarina brevivitae]